MGHLYSSLDLLFTAQTSDLAIILTMVLVCFDGNAKWICIKYLVFAGLLVHIIF